MNNVEDTGHLVEQPTQVRNFRPELGVFHGYAFRRSSTTVIEVWRPAACDNCACSTHSSGHFVRVGSATDEEIIRHGLRLAEGPSPVRSIRVHSEGPLLCEPCKTRWLRGDAMEGLGEVWARSYTWN